jgi:glyoxylate/hydroxypyruvate reductase A
VNVWSRSRKPVPSGITGFRGRDGPAAMLPETEILVNLLPLTAETAAYSTATCLAPCGAAAT